MSAIVLYGHSKMYRDLSAGCVDKDSRSDIALECGTRGLGANAKQKATMTKLGRGDFSLLIDEDGKLTAVIGGIKRPKVPTLPATDWLKLRIPSEQGRKDHANFVQMLTARYPEASLNADARYLNYNMNVTPPKFGLRIGLCDLSGAEWDDLVALAKDMGIPCRANYDRSCEPHLDFGGHVDFTWPMEKYYPQPDSKRPEPFQNYIFEGVKIEYDTRKDAKYRKKAAGTPVDQHEKDVLAALKLPGRKGVFGGPWRNGERCNWAIGGRRATLMGCKALVAKGLAYLKIKKGISTYYAVRAKGGR